MERDFMGLKVKHETPEETTDAAPTRSSPMQWSFSNKSSAQLLSFKGATEDKPNTRFDSLSSSPLMTLTTAEAFDSAAQKNIVPEKQSGVRYTVTTYPMANQTNITISPAVTTSLHQSLVATSVSSNPLSGVPVANPVPARPSSSPVVGTTDLRSSSNISAAPAQLTIFYNGSVCVYDNISPEKAQAIMLLAGNGPPATSSATPPPPAAPVPVPVPVQASIPRTSSVLDGFVVSQTYGASPRRSNPIPVTPISVSESVGRNNIDKSVVKPAGTPLTLSHIAKPLKSVGSLTSVSTNFMSSGTVPQFRRKSLARFLEKRKDRVISSSPYGNKKSPDCNTPGDDSTCLSANSLGSCPVPAIH